MAENQKVHMKKHLHPVFVLAVILFFFLVIYILFFQHFNASGEKLPGRQAQVSDFVKPRFDKKPQERVGPYRYTSEFMKISFDVPAGYRVEERGVSIILTKEEENIIVSRSTTPFDSVKAHFNLLKQRNKLITNSEDVVQYRLDGLRVSLKDISVEDSDLLYLFYKDGFVYIVEGRSQSSEKDLEFVAQSFFR